MGWPVADSASPIPLLVTMAEAGKLLACSPSTIRNLCQRGELHPIHFGAAVEREILRDGKRIKQVHGGAVRIDVADLRRFIECRKAQAPAVAQGDAP